MSHLDDRLKKAKCQCGARAEKEILLQGGEGLTFVYLCAPCLAKVYAHAAAILKLTGATKYALAPCLRPDEDGP
ncbi:MAG: hypothetical protein WC869_01005 [Phycisphaerae bacterium]|jgi:hypothetical protein